MEAAYLAAFFGGLVVFFGTHYFTVFRREMATASPSACTAASIWASIRC